jgi:hypothetical protein
MGKVFGKNSAAWLLFLRDLVAIAVYVLSEVGSIVIMFAARAGYGDMGRAQLGVVKEECGLCGGFLLESDGCFFVLASCRDLDVGDLATIPSS